MDSSQQALQTNGKLFSNFEYFFEFLAENRNFSKRLARREYWSNWNVSYIIGFVSTSSTNEWKTLFKFHIRLWIIDRKPKNIQANTEVWILIIKVQCVMYQWICLDKLYKLMKSFFQISESFFEFVTIFWNNSGVVFMHARRGRHLCWTTRVLVEQGNIRRFI